MATGGAAAAGGEDIEVTDITEDDGGVGVGFAPATALTAAVDANLVSSLPVAAKIHLHELISENSVLKARLRATVLELKNTRELCNRLSNQLNKRGPPPPTTTTTARNVPEGSKKQATRLHDPIATSTATQTSPMLPEPPTTAPTLAKTTATVVGCIGTQTEAAASPDTTIPQPQQEYWHQELLRKEELCSSLERQIRELTENRNAAEQRSVMKQRMDDLSEALRQANETILNLEGQLLEMRLNHAVVPSPPPEGEPLVTATKETSTTDLFPPSNAAPSTAAVLPPSSPRRALTEPEEVRSNAYLEQALEMTRAQLQAALSELREVSSTSRRRDDTTMPRAISGVASVGVSCDFTLPIAQVFEAHGLPFTVASAEELALTRIRQLEAAQVRSESDVTYTANAANSAAVREVLSDLDATRKELVAAHRHIDELHYALELQRRCERSSSPYQRYQQLSPLALKEDPSATAPRSSSPLLYDATAAAGNKQAAAEIAFLCDTLEATKRNLDAAETQLRQARAERDAAVRAFDDLKSRTESVLAGCQEITEATQAEADHSIAALTESIHAKDAEINGLKNQIAALRRNLESTQRSISAARKENESLRQEASVSQTTIKKLTEEAALHMQQLREMRARHQQLVALLPSPRSAIAASEAVPRTLSPRGNGAATPPQQPTSLEALLQDGERDPAGSASNQHPQLHDDEKVRRTPRREQQPSYAALRSNSSGSSSRRRRGEASSGPEEHRQAGAARSASATGILDEQRAEYEELRTCLLQLRSTAALNTTTTAREVTDATISLLHAQRQRIATLESELRKRTVSLQSVKKELEAKTAALADLQKKSGTILSLEQRVTVLNRTADKLKQQSAAERREHEQTIATLSDNIRALQAELDATKEALNKARNELNEGRQLLLQLIGQDGGDAVSALLSAAVAATGEEGSSEG